MSTVTSSPQPGSSPRPVTTRASGRGGDAGARRPELDGLRGIAVLLVVIAHVTAGAWPNPTSRGAAPLGGLVGVQLFFVLSGFLITGLLLRDRETGRNLGSFYARRARRLLPALAVTVMLLAVGISVGWFAGADFSAEALSAFTYSTNVGHFVAGMPHAEYLGHLWSLAVEEQFYALWPLVVIVANRYGGRGRVGQVAVVLAVLVFAVHVAHGSTSATYELLRWDAIFAGCALACFDWRPSRRLALFGLGMVLGESLIAGTLTPWHYLAATVGGVLVVAGARGLPVTHPVLRHFGRISYGLYLFHALLLRAPVSPLLMLAVSLALTEVSFYGLELRFTRSQTSGEGEHVADVARGGRVAVRGGVLLAGAGGADV